ncbi:ESX secretion-associated protein EspG [Nocardia flavorosea]|uniref:ESX secretion-associated protein EspG n=1 Tax=Nocardia flavorosea TaxID=53429 RepID=UPI0018949199|nr:ESX secretion-associated protein EspG [Nocardia flavorosea]MBF6349194.1 ESX secretion-associated protein EspG [Nocardia flavorosea]
MNRRWELTDLEFKVLCEKHGQPRLPRPFTFTSRIRLEDDYEMAKANIRGRLLRLADADLDELGTALDRPDVYVAAQSWTDGDFENPADRTRMLAVRRGTRGYLVTQRPGETLAHSAGFDVLACHPESLGDAVLAGLPFAESGRLPDIPVPQPAANAGDIGFVLGGSMVSDNDEPEDDDSYRATAFFESPATRSGYIRVYQGRSKFGPRGRIDMGVLWRDLPGDGRYVIPMDHPAPVAAGSGTEEMVKWVDQQVAFVMSRLEWNWEDE